MDDVLTRPELKKRFGGYTRKTIIRALDRNKVPYIIGADEWPRVSRRYVDQLMSGERPEKPRYDSGPAWTKAPA